MSISGCVCKLFSLRVMIVEDQTADIATETQKRQERVRRRCDEREMFYERENVRKNGYGDDVMRERACDDVMRERACERELVMM